MVTGVSLFFGAISGSVTANAAAGRQVTGVHPDARPAPAALRPRRPFAIPPSPTQAIHPAVPRSTSVAAPSAVVGGTWNQLGPKPIVGAGTCCNPNTSPITLAATYGKTGGRVTSIAVDPTNTSIVYAGTAGGGVWKSTDGGSTWTSTSAAQSSIAGVEGASAIGALAIDPTTPTTVYAGTGEDNQSESQAGWGLLKTIDGGTTWTNIGSGTFARQHIGDLLVDRNNHLRVFAATDIGLYVSTDAGTTWTKVTLPNITAQSGKQPFQAATQIIQDPSNAAKFWVTVTDFCANDAGDVLTGDGGSNWTTTKIKFVGIASRIGLAVTANNIAYFAAADCLGNLADIEKTTDGGATWTAISITSTTSGIFNYFNAGGVGQGDYDNAVAIDPTNANKVVFAGIWTIATADGGTTFQDITHVYNGGVVHPDFHAVTYTGGNTFYLGSDGGVWFTDDMGGLAPNPSPGTPDWANLNNTFNTVQYYTGSALDSNHVFGGAQDNGSTGILPGGATPPAWQEYLDGDGGYTAIDPTPGSTTLYAEVPRLDIFRGSSTLTSAPASPYDSFVEAGPCRSSFNSGDPACTDPADFVGPFAMDPTNHNNLLAGTNKVYLSTNGGGSGGPQSWLAISGDITTGTSNFAGRPDVLSVITMGSQGLAGPVITGTRFGAVFMTTNGSTATPASWVNITGNLPKPSTNPQANTFVFANPWISGAVINPDNPSEAWVTLGGINTVGGVYHTLNAGAPGGTKWNGIGGVAPPSVPDVSVNSLAIDPTTSHPSAIYIATDTGVMVCNPCTGPAADTGATWMAVGAGLPNVKVNAITFSRDQKNLIAWTHGLGAWSLPTPGWDQLGGVLASRPVSTTWGPNRLDTFVLGTDHQIWHNWYDGVNWNWEPLPGQVTSDATAVAPAMGQLDVFVRGADNSLKRDHWTSATGWTGWTSLGGKLAAEPSATNNAASGQIIVFVEGTDQRLYAWSSTTGWQPWSGGVLAVGPAAVSAGAEYDAFVEGTDRHLWYWSSTTGWHGLGGVLANKPAAISWGTGRLDAFVEGTDSALWHWSSASGWEGLGGRLATKPAAVTWGTPRLDAFVQGTDNNLWHAWSTGSGWVWEQLLGAQLNIDPSAVSWASGRIDVFIRATDNSLWHHAVS